MPPPPPPSQPLIDILAEGALVTHDEPVLTHRVTHIPWLTPGSLRAVRPVLWTDV